MTDRGLSQSMRYAYIKHGDAVDQVRRLSRSQEFDRSGPDAFIGDFLRAHSADQVFIACRARHNETFRSGSVEARSFAGDRAHGAGLLRRIASAVRVGIATLRFRPQRILCGCTGELLWICVLVAKVLRVPVVNSRHGELQQRSGLGALVSVLDHACIRACTAVVCHGPFMADQILHLGVAASRIFQFEVDLSTFATSPRRPVSPVLDRFMQAHRHVFTFIGRMQGDKGIFDLLEAFTAIAPGHTAGLIYAGDGGEAGTLEREVQNSESRDHVLLLGRVPHAELTDIIRGSTAIVTPTRPEFPEGRCMVVLESLVLGIPVIAPRSGPFPYAIRDEVNGLLFTSGDWRSLRECLGRVVGSDDLLGRLRAGAEEAGAQLLESPISFSQAVRAAFDADDAPRDTRGVTVGSPT